MSHSVNKLNITITKLESPTTDKPSTPTLPTRGQLQVRYSESSISSLPLSSPLCTPLASTRDSSSSSSSTSKDQAAKQHKFRFSVPTISTTSSSSSIEGMTDDEFFTLSPDSSASISPKSRRNSLLSSSTDTTPSPSPRNQTRRSSEDAVTTPTGTPPTIDSDDETPANKNRVFRPFLSPTKEADTVRGPNKHAFKFDEPRLGSKESLLKFFKDNSDYFKSCTQKDLELIQEKFAEYICDGSKIDYSGILNPMGRVSYLCAAQMVCNSIKAACKVATFPSHTRAFRQALEAYAQQIIDKTDIDDSDDDEKSSKASLGQIFGKDRS